MEQGLELGWGTQDWFYLIMWGNILSINDHNKLELSCVKLSLSRGFPAN
jgi:hypothetical protein